MPKIVISYRRSDSKEITGHIYERLCRRFGKRNVFMDIDNIPAGVDFRQHVDRALQNADVLLAIVGPGWLNVQATGHSTLHSDWVGVEVGTGLKKEGLRIIPVLVRGARMPDPKLLPPALRDFAFLNAEKVEAGRDFNIDIARLIRAISSRSRWTVLSIAACILLLLIGGSAAIWRYMPRAEPAAPEPVAAKVPAGPSTAVVRQLPLAEGPQVEPPKAPAETARLPSPAANTASAPKAATAPLPVPDTAPSAPIASPPATATIAPAKPPVPPVEWPAETVKLRAVTALEGETFGLCGQSDFVGRLWTPGASSPPEVWLRRDGATSVSGPPLKLQRGKPKPLTDDCAVTFIEVRRGLAPIMVFEERQTSN